MLVFAGSSDEDPIRARHVIEAFVSHRVDGLIVMLAGPDHDGLLVDQQRQGKPVILVDRKVDFLETDSVTVDNRVGALEAVRHLAAHGHRRIAFLGDARSIWTAQERHAGYSEGLSTQGIPYDPELVRQDFPTVELAEGATLDLLASAHPPTALFTAQNLITLGAVQALRQRGLQHRVALLGFDDLTLGDLLDPAISAVVQDPRAVGRTAAELLFARLAGDRGPSKHVVVPTRMVVRGSGEIAAP
jgi:LacI family transcriptional regulator